MDLFALRTFVCVQENQSFSKAGEQLLLTQPAVSKRIAALELELGVRLFDRVGKKVMLTEAGRQLFDRAQSILLELEDCRRAISNLGQTVTGRLSFATSHHIGLHRLPPILKQYTTKYPLVELDIQFMDSELACSALTAGTVELALTTMPGILADTLDATPVWHDTLVPVVDRDHDLAIKGTVTARVTPEKLAAFPAILPGSGTFTRKMIETKFASMGLNLEVRLSTNYLETIMMLVTVGLGWGILPQSMVEKQGDALYPIELTGINFERVLGVIHHRQRTLSKAAQAMLSILDKEIKPQ